MNELKLNQINSTNHCTYRNHNMKEEGKLTHVIRNEDNDKSSSKY